MDLVERVYIYAYREVDEIYRLIPEDQWVYYKAMGVVEQREQLLLAAGYVKLRESFTSQVLDYEQVYEPPGE